MRFILVDEILALVPGRTITAVKAIVPEEDYFRDHFPGFPVVPGVLLVEMMAQAAGMCLDAEGGQRGKAMLARITTASFHEWVRPGQTATIFAEIGTSRPQFATAKCRLEVTGCKVGTADLFFSFVPKEQFAAEYRDAVLERFLARHPEAVSSPGGLP